MATPKSPKRSAAKRHAQIENISIMESVGRMGPLGLWVYAEAYLRAGKAVPAPTVPFEPTRYFLICHSVELGLKAFLSVQGSTMLQLADYAYGHNLVSILAAAESQGLFSTVPLSTAQLAEITKASEYYVGKVFEYPAVGEAISAYPSLPDLTTLLDAAELLVKHLEQPCKAA